MARSKIKDAVRISAYFLADTFVIDWPDPDSDVTQSTGLTNENLKAWIASYEADKYSALFHLGFLTRPSEFDAVLDYLHSIAELLIRSLSHQPDIEFSREAVQVDLADDDIRRLLDELPFGVGMEYVDDEWLRGLWRSLLAVFKADIEPFDGTVARYFAEQNAQINIAGRVFFHLVESQDEPYPFAFMATYSTKPGQSKRAVHTPLKHALKEFDGDEQKLLSLISSVVKAAEKSAFISDLLESGELFAPIKLTIEEAYTFLKDIEIFEDAGILCRVPDWWRKRRAYRLAITVGGQEPSRLGLDAIIGLVPTLRIGDDEISEADLREFLDMSEGLIQYKGQWVEINRKRLATVLEALDKVKAMAGQETLSLADAMRLELNADQLVDTDDDSVLVSVSNGEWLRALKDKLVNPDKIEEVAMTDSFQRVLRPYQKTGYHWFSQMAQLGFGACLADDMGLGKTIQLIAYLEYYRLNRGGQSLLVLPASLIGNWQREIERFAPDMPYQILHKSDLKGTETLLIRDDSFLCITTYGMTIRLEALQNRRWDHLILDEAQAIKNPATKQTKAIKSIQAGMRIALTGTPIENRLGDLWSLFDFLNPGLLGTAKEFTDFTKRLSEHASGYAKLRKIIHPFILRRLKTDKRIISDLPDKVEINAYTALSKKQTALYRQLLAQIAEKLETAEGIDRKGLVLASIMKFKQICNHPDHYLGREIFKPEHSGKFEQLREICETIRDKRERVLVFTQFREMTEPLASFLSDVFGREGLVLHGGTPVKRRREIVEQFNGEHYVPFMVLSLKAGGVGLNLTAANHVVHFDRWWNPAVENQATDRAFRIGQTRNVMVHKFVSNGTIEEKINAMIEDKQKLSGELLNADGENWITEYSNEDLMRLFELGGDEA